MGFIRCVCLAGLVVFLGACGGDPEGGREADDSRQTSAKQAEGETAVAPEGRDQGERAITGDGLAAHIQRLASDEFEGRAPASPGGEKTVAYITDQFRQAGLKPGNEGNWHQEVPLVSITLEPDTTLTIDGLGEPLEVPHDGDAVVWTKRVTDSVSLDASDMVFVGYGIVAPEYDWNDYEDLDVEGKTVVMLVNDPGFATQDEDLFNGNAMTYYGRWTYKYEEAARQGASGAIVIHETEPAGYPWDVVSGSWTGPQFDLVSENRNQDRAKLEGWIKHGLADRLFSHVGMSYPEAKEAALRPDFQPVPLDLSVSATLRNDIEETRSRNVIGILPGGERPNETVLYMAHWDHLGTKPDREGDKIFNGAVDNATGVAGLIEIAEAMTARPEPPERSVVFLAVTAEEQGLLGSRHYAENPVYPLSKTAATINMDGLAPYGETRDVVVVGHGSSELEDYLAEAAERQGRRVEPESTPEKGYYYRSDHFNLAKQGVPSLYAEAGTDLVEGGTERGERLQAEYVEKHYHKPSDEFGPDWDLGGIVQDVRLFREVGERIADSDAWPNWYEGNEFRAIREQSKDQR
jgi:Zn-dependent M28 family amino/carboxypeptidase